MKLREFDFNSIKNKHSIVGLSIKEVGTNKWYSGFIGEVLQKLPIEFADKEIVETRWFFNEFVIEVK